MKKLALALVVGIFSVGAVSAQTNQKTKVKTDKNEVKIKSETNASKAEMKQHDGRHQEHKSPEEKAKMRTEKMTKELNLTDDQAQRVYQLNLQKTQQMHGMKEQAAADRQAKKAAMQEVRQAWENDLKAALTSEQYTKYQALKAERKSKMQEHHKGMHHKGNYKK